MSHEHRFTNVYWLGYGDAVREHRRGAWPAIALLLLAVALLAFWAGRVSMKPEVESAYGAGFDAGVLEGTTNWGDWR